jgi:formiminoglutamase
MELTAVDQTRLPDDPLWPRAGAWVLPAAGQPSSVCDLALLGIPAHATSITPTGANTTPNAVREALLRYSTYDATHGVDVSTLRALDFGDVVDPDGREGEARTSAAVAAASRDARLLVALGGDNSITYAVMRGLFPEGLEGCGLVTLDAHHDLRDGETNGSPVRRLLDAGLPGSHIAQIGIADFSNSRAYSERARENHITVISRSEVREHGLVRSAARALGAAGDGGRPVFVDIDVDVCDRAEVPGCPAAAPGGITADELRHFALHLARSPQVRGIDITEVDATADTADGRTVRLAALLVLEAAAGVALRHDRRAV